MNIRQRFVVTIIPPPLIIRRVTTLTLPAITELLCITECYQLSRTGKGSLKIGRTVNSTAQEFIFPPYMDFRYTVKLI